MQVYADVWFGLCVCLSAWMPVGSVTKHNVAEIKLVPASFTLLSPSFLSLNLPLASPICDKNIPMVPHHLVWRVFITLSLFCRLLWFFWFGKVDHLSSGSILIWLSNRQQHCPSPAQKQEQWGWITCGSLSLHILSNLPHELQAGLGCSWWSCVALYG